MLIESRIANPLAEIPIEELMDDVELFCTERGLEDKTDLIKKGALVARDPANYESIGMLDEEEKEALRYEIAHKWRHPFALYVTIVICSIGAAVQVSRKTDTPIDSLRGGRSA